MPSEVEAYLYRNFGVHGLVSITFSGDSIDLTVAPFTDFANTFSVKFLNSKLRYIQNLSDPDDDWLLPWDIIAFDCKQLNERWEFLLYSGFVEVAFVADWPIPKAKIS